MKILKLTNDESSFLKQEILGIKQKLEMFSKKHNASIEMLIGIEWKYLNSIINKLEKIC